MQTYIYTMWLMWPKAGDPGEIVRHAVDSLEHCRAIADYYFATIAADGVTYWAWSCVEQWGV